MANRMTHPPESLLRAGKLALLLTMLGALGACGGSHLASRGVRATPSRYYPPPGPPEDPWGPYIQEASSRFGVPDPWIRAVMRQESAGNEDALSSAGAMGLMQVMPTTYDGLRIRHGLGDDPFDPHNNMLAGTAYLREMYDRYGAPGFLAAYNAGPNRLEQYLGGGGSLPDETVTYVATIAPRLGAGTPLTGPLAVYGAAYAPLVRTASLEATSGGCDSDAAYDPTQPCAPTTPVAANSGVPIETIVAGGNWQVQVGAFRDSAVAREVATAARDGAPEVLGAAQIELPASAPSGGAVLYRARLTGLSARQASEACDALGRRQMPCRIVRPDQS